MKKIVLYFAFLSLVLPNISFASYVLENVYTIDKTTNTDADFNFIDVTPTATGDIFTIEGKVISSTCNPANQFLSVYVNGGSTSTIDNTADVNLSSACSMSMLATYQASSTSQLRFSMTNQGSNNRDKKLRVMHWTVNSGGGGSSSSSATTTLATDTFDIFYLFFGMILLMWALSLYIWFFRPQKT